MVSDFQSPQLLQRLLRGTEQSHSNHIPSSRKKCVRHATAITFYSWSVVNRGLGLEGWCHKMTLFDCVYRQFHPEVYYGSKKFLTTHYLYMSLRKSGLVPQVPRPQIATHMGYE